MAESLQPLLFLCWETKINSLSCHYCQNDLQENEEVFNYKNNNYCEECYYDRSICNGCDGTGEGQVGEFRCWHCKGSGQSASLADEQYAENYEPDYERIVDAEF